MEITERDKACIEVNKDFLVALSSLYSTQAKELLHSTIAYSHQAIRGMFLLHGACATAIVATKEIAVYKCMLVWLAVGALLSVACAGLSYLAQVNHSKYYSSVATVNLQTFHDKVQHLIRPDYNHLMTIVNAGNSSFKKANWFSNIACALWAISACIFVYVIVLFVCSR